MDELDRPIWHALAGRQRRFAQGSALARRFHPDVSPFAACRDDGPAALAALAALVPETGVLVLLQAGDTPVPDGCEAAFTAQGVQLVLREPGLRRVGHPVVELGDADAAEMLALADLTRPGPFLPSTRSLGQFVGVRVDGGLAAMAGERLMTHGFTEVSAVCTHPDFRGRGMAAQLIMVVADRILARGETPFLHAFADNCDAIRLYEALGFAKRRDMSVLALQRPAST